MPPVMPLADGGRVGGAADRPVAVHRSFTPNDTPPEEYVVGVVDTGFPANPHPWLREHLEDPSAAAEPLPEPPSLLGPDDGHGTFVAGRIVLEAPAVRVRMVRPATWADDDVSSAIAAAAESSELINLSFLGVSTEREPPARIARTLAELPPETVVVIAAGNNYGSEIVYPAGIELPEGSARIITVGAVDQTRIAQAGAAPPLAGFSDFGAWVDCYAEGVQLLGPFLEYDEVAEPDGARVPQSFHGWAVWSGTSFATATVTGRIARVAMELKIPAMKAAELVVDSAPRIPVPRLDHSMDDVELRPFVRGVSSTWGEIHARA